MLAARTAGVVLACRPEQLDRRHVVMRERSPPVVGAVVGKRLDPVGGTSRDVRRVRRAGSGRTRRRERARAGTRAAMHRRPLERCSRRTNSLRSRARSASWSCHGSSPATVARASVQKTFPSTAACWRSSFSSVGRRSIRAVTIPCTVSGSRPSHAPAGLEHAHELLRVERVACRALDELRLLRRPASTGCPSSARTRRAVSSSSAGRARRWSRCASLLPIPAGVRGAPAVPCTMTSSGTPSPSRRARR